MEQELYYEVYESSGMYGWRIYHYNATGNRQIVVHHEKEFRHTEDGAMNDCEIFMDEHDIDATLA